MSNDEPFLARWSRRKRGEGAEEPAEGVPAPDPPEADAPEATPAASDPTAELPELPPLETIDASTDIRAFLARGVPATLRQAALRRAWSADPSIRDFIGLSENSWDFTAPDGVPGFGPMLPADPARSLADLVRAAGSPESGELPASPAPESDPAPAQNAPGAPRHPPQHDLVTKDESAAGDIHSSPDAQAPSGADKKSQDVAPQKASSADIMGNVTLRHRHGGALPG